MQGGGTVKTPATITAVLYLLEDGRAKSPPQGVAFELPCGCTSGLLRSGEFAWRNVNSVLLLRSALS